MPSLNEANDLTHQVHKMLRKIMDDTLAKPTLEPHDRELIKKLLFVMSEQIEYQQKLIGEILNRLPPPPKAN